MQPDQPPGGRSRRGPRGKLKQALRDLAEGARAFLLKGKAFPHPDLLEVYRRWRAWKDGHSPSRLPGYGAQNPNLLEAFAILDEVARQAEIEREHEREKRLHEFLARLMGARG